MIWQNSGKSGRENMGPCVIACDKRKAFAQGSNATKQSSTLKRQRWIASLSLAMAGSGRGMTNAKKGRIRPLDHSTAKH
ncbi:hypothetical protein [Bradyrhizobium sp.]|uniref:hypothetical protein n=1 Tax=Bradyrhizobium sp. TaxID=376 RepID=UPI002D226FEF|nr:hypothetical protein [Bradyrhizobium sp.]HZR76341.1 hypothetical protein [Bradyrhizobium sp.]